MANGSLPPGLFLNANTGLISGTPTTAGTYSFQIGVKDADGCTAFMTYTIVISCPTITFTPPTLPGGTAGVLYPPVTIMVTGGTGLLHLAWQM